MTGGRNVGGLTVALLLASSVHASAVLCCPEPGQSGSAEPALDRASTVETVIMASRRPEDVGQLSLATQKVRQAGCRTGWLLGPLRARRSAPANWLALTRAGQPTAMAEPAAPHYLSPFHDEARAAMVKLVEELARLTTAPDFTCTTCNARE